MVTDLPYASFLNSSATFITARKTEEFHYSCPRKARAGKMSKRNRSRAERSAAKRKWKQAQALKDLSLSNGATDAQALITLSHAMVGNGIQELKQNTAFAPEFPTSLREKGCDKMGSGDSVSLSLQWEEIRAVNDRYPVSRPMLERLAFEAMQIAMRPTTATRDKLIATKLILAMANANNPNALHPKGLRAQKQAGFPRTEEERIAILALIEEVPIDDPSLDFRPFKVAPGSPEDYAE